VAAALGVAEVELLGSLLGSALRGMEAVAAWPVLRVLGVLSTMSKDVVIPLLTQLLEVRCPVLGRSARSRDISNQGGR